MPPVSTIVIGVLILMLGGLSVVFIDKSASVGDKRQTKLQAAATKVIEVDEELVPLHREPAPPPPPAPAPVVAPEPAPAPPAPAPAAEAPKPAPEAPAPAPAPA
ncbi:MAG TPA: hypothetical protein VHL54_04035, partial [Actinomycetota bacterium]|nr:hypothetical protein [Actinomycetota bacterium]